MNSEKCKPGGCASFGCDGGHYCFAADGTPRLPVNGAVLDRALNQIFATQGNGEPQPEKDPERNYAEEVRQIEENFNKRVAASARIERLFCWGVAIVAILLAIAFPIWKYVTN